MRLSLLCCLFSAACVTCCGVAQTVTTPAAPYVPHAPVAPTANGPEAATPTLHISSRMVEISAVVKGKDGAPLAELQRDDFLVKQDGQPVQLRYFSEGNDLPLTMALLVDTSASQHALIGDEVLASDVFFQAMLTEPKDRAMLVRVDASVTEVIGLTESSSRLHLGLTALNENPATSNATRLNDAVYSVSRIAFARERGRKAIIILSDGGENGSKKSLEDAIEQAERGNVQIYCILYSNFTGGGTLNYGLQGLKAGTVDGGAELLKRLSQSTGGRVYTVGHGMSLRQIYADIAQELRVQYQLGYTPPPDLRPNSFHKLEISVKEKKLAVQARSGFYAAP